MRTRALACAFALLLGRLVGGLASPASAADVNSLNTVDQYVTALRANPILVQQVKGAGHTDAVRKKLAELAAALPYPVHVALVQDPTDLQSDDVARDLASALRRRLDSPGLYIVAAQQGILQIQVTGTAVDQTELSLAHYDVLKALVKKLPKELDGRTTSALEAQLTLEVAAAPGFAHYDFEKQQDKPVLTDSQITALAHEPWGAPAQLPDVDSESHLGKRWMVATTAGLGSFLLVGMSLVGWPGWRRTTKSQKPRPTSSGRVPIETVRRHAEESLTSLAGKLADLPPTPVHPEIAADALAAREAAEWALRGQYVDVVGALTLAQSGLADVERAGRERAGDPYRPCWFNPLHGSATTETMWRYGDAEVSVPVCRQCDRAVRANRTPDVLRVGDSASSRAYFEEKSVWVSTGFGALVDHYGASVLRERGARS